MKKGWMDIFLGKHPIPESVKEQAALLVYAEAHHVLGQMAHHWKGQASGKLSELLENGLLRAAFDHKMLTFEMDRIERAIVGSVIKPVLLKGGAYVALNLAASKGRRVSDLDILVPSSELEEMEHLLRDAGWQYDEKTDNQYDQHYYRTHMHELPPLRHEKRRSVLDVHHLLLPRTSRFTVRTDKLIEAAIPLANTCFRVFNPVDLFIHSAVHAFFDGSFDTSTRTLIELHYLFEDLTDTERNTLFERAREVGAERAVGTAVWCLAHIVKNLQADEIYNSAQPAHLGFQTHKALLAKTKNVEQAVVAKTYLYIRSHFIRMPLLMLLKHLARKLVRAHSAAKPE